MFGAGIEKVVVNRLVTCFRGLLGAGYVTGLERASRRGSFTCMNLNPLTRAKSVQAQPSISVEDVERVRRQRRLAKTEEEHSAVRSQMRDLVGELRSTPVRNSKLTRIAGIIILVIGVIVGALLFYSAYLLWPHFVEHVEGL